jgi:adenosylcobinamide-GDP ribazoletransferase
MDDDALRQAAAYMPLFPIVGGIIGLLCGVSVWFLETLLPSSIAGFLGLGLILLLTGAHHTDGLLDFGDAMMSHGSKEARLRVMRDLQTGTGGFTLGLVILTTTALSIGAIDRSLMIPTLIASEASAKFAMVSQAAFGRPAHRGMSTPFIKAMQSKGKWFRFGVALLLELVIGAATLHVVGLLLALFSLIVGLVMLAISSRAFGGITGDVLGASNDLARLLSIMTVVVTAKWL